MESASRPATSGDSLFNIVKFPSALLRHHHWLAEGPTPSARSTPRGLTAQDDRRRQHGIELSACASKIKVCNVRGCSSVYTRKKYLREKPCHRTTLRLKASVSRHRNEDKPQTAVFTGWVPCGMDAISTFALLDLLGLPKTTGNGRRIAQTMRSLGFVPIKSRRLEPGGYRDTVTRGWARPVRESRCRTSLNLGDSVGTSHFNNPMHSGTN